MAVKKPSYEERFSGKTRSIILNLNNIYLDSGSDIREKHMFGHKAYLLRGHVMMLVGEWARDEKPREKMVEVASRGELEPTLIVVPPDEALAERIRRKFGGLYFAPGGTRLKHWLSLKGAWLHDEAAVEPLIKLMLISYSAMPQKELKNPGRSI